MAYKFLPLCSMEEKYIVFLGILYWGPISLRILNKLGKMNGSKYI